MALRCAVAGLLLGVAEAPPGPEPQLSLAWASSPVFANETLLLHGTFAESGGGGGGGLRLRVQLTPLAPGQAAAPLVLEPALPPSAVSLMVVLPPSLPDSAYSVRVLDDSSRRSNALEINQPEAWWVQGDAGNFSTPGGWVRVFGRALTLAGRRAAPHPAESADEPEAVETRIREAIAAGDMAALNRLHESQRARAASQRQRLAQTNTTLHLVPAGGGTGPPVTLAAAAITMWSAVFPVPRSLRAGRYTASLSNGHGPPVPIDCFVSPSLPSVRWVDIAEDAWPPPHNFSVAAFGETAPIVGRDPPGGVEDGSSRPPLPWLMPVNSTTPMLAALAAAERAGGGTVLLPEGVLAMEPGLAVPHNVLLRGARTDLSAIHFLYDQAPPGAVRRTRLLLASALLFQDWQQASCRQDQHLPFAHIHRAGVDRPGRWGLSDLTVYQLGRFCCERSERMYANRDSSLGLPLAGLRRALGHGLHDGEGADQGQRLRLRAVRRPCPRPRPQRRRAHPWYVVKMGSRAASRSCRHSLSAVIVHNQAATSG